MTGPEPDAPPGSEPEHHLRDLVDPGTDTVVLVPGIDGTAELFYRQIPLLARSFNVVAFPLPDRREATMDDLVGDLAALIAEVSNRPVILCGESFGGALSMSLALARPELVGGLVIINSFPYLANRVQLAVAPVITKLIPWAAMPVIRRVTEHRIHSAHTLRQDLHEFRTRMRGIGRGGYIRRLEIIRGYDVRSRLGDLAAPVLFLAGTEDKLVPSIEWATFMHERVPGSELIALDGHGHCCLINHDLDLDELIGRWWADAPRRALDS